MAHPDEFDIVSRAEGFAKAAHFGQKYGDLDYWHHCSDVVTQIESFDWGKDAALLAAGWLHDVLEDTKITKEYLEKHFSTRIVAIVVAVTDEPGRNRAERKKVTYKKIAAFGPSAIKLKLADRIANVCSCSRDNKQLLEMYRKEHAEFRGALYHSSLPELFRAQEYLDTLLGL